MVLILKISLAHAYMVMVLVRSQNFSDFRLLLQFQDYYFAVPNKKKIGFYPRLMEAFPAA